MRLLSLLVFVGCGNSITGAGDGKEPVDSDGTRPPTLSFTTTEVAFGEMAYGELDVRTLSFTNIGEEPLALSDVAVDAPFEVSPDSLPIQPAGTAQLTLSLQMADYLDHVGALTFTTNDPARPEVSIPLSAYPIRDADGDGYLVAAADGDDCDDNDATVHPDAEETWYDGIDQNCDAANDFDRDGDGYEADTDAHHPAEPDCNDTLAEYHPGAEDVPYDGHDANCDDADDYDVDGDGERAPSWGEDCDDLDPDVNTSAVEVLDGADNDCNGAPDDDAAFLGAHHVWEADGRYDQLGGATALADLDGDGFSDVVVGAAFAGAATPSAKGEGAVAVFAGAASLALSGTRADEADAYVQGASSSTFGTTITILGDWDGDTLDDVAVHAGNEDDGAGAVYVFSGRELMEADGVDAADLHITGQASEAFGASLGTRVDLDGDGLGELVAGFTSGADDGLTVLYGGAVGELGSADLGARWLSGGGRLQQAGVIGADLDADGRDDLVVGAAEATVDGMAGAGVVWVLHGAPEAYETAADATLASEDWSVALSGSAAADGVGAVVQTGPDWDENGHDEVWVYDDGSGVYVVDGTALVGDDPKAVATAGWSWASSTADAARLARAGDWDGDGTSDMVVWFDHASGEMALFGTTRRAGVSAWSEDRLAWVTGSSLDGNSSAGLGLAAEGADVDGDGDDDYVTGDPGFDANAGEVYLFLQR